MRKHLYRIKKKLYDILNMEEVAESIQRKHGGVKFMCKACELGKIIINECYERNISISTAKLQKLLVLMHGEHLAKYEKTLFPEQVLCWGCGVAIKEIEIKFLLHNFSTKERLPQQIAILNSEEAVIDDVLDKYGHMDVLELNKDIRLVELINMYPYKEGQRIVIPNDDIKKVFKDYGQRI